METIDIIKLVALVLLILLSAFFSSAETAFTAVSQISMMTLADEGNKKAKKVLKIKENTHKMLSAILIGNNVVNLSASALATAFALKLFGDWGSAIATGVLTFLLLIFGEITPKTIATIKAEKTALRYSGIIWTLMIVLTPIIFVVNKLSYGFMRMLGVDASQAKNAMTEDEIRTVVEVGAENDIIEDEERDIINNLFDFSDDEVKEVMLPRVDVIYMGADMTYDEMMKVYLDSYYTRYPVCEEGSDDVIGILNMKDVLGFTGVKGDFKIREIMREPFFTYEHKKVYELFMEMKADRLNFAIVLDEYGATAGIITMEDFLEEIVGEIRDEFDTDERDMIEAIPGRDGVYRVDASVNFEDFCRELELDLSSDVSDTLAGFIMEIYGGVPEEGEEVSVENVVNFRILSMDNKRIDTVETIKLTAPEDEAEDAQ